MANRMRSWAKERAWRQRVAAWRKSGLTARAFCRKFNLSENSFYGWRRVLAQRDREADRAASTKTAAMATRRRSSRNKVPAATSRQRPSLTTARHVSATNFVPMKVYAGSTLAEGSIQRMGPDTNLSSGLEVVVSSGRVVRLSRAFDAATLARLLAVLEAR